LRGLGGEGVKGLLRIGPIFRDTRKVELKKWLDITGRRISQKKLDSDNFQNAYECKWQDSNEVGHVNLFCSLGDWACNVTDLLRDDRFDKLGFGGEGGDILFRHYTRIMLIISEILTDFQDIYLHVEDIPIRPAGKEKTDKARRFYFPKGKEDNITMILGYINTVCKHKTQNLHICNNHATIFFEDYSALSETLNKVISIRDRKMAPGKNIILVPRLSFLIDTVLQCYKVLDEYFAKNPDKYLRLCKKFAG
jgi:hypothetical protein